MYGPWLPMTEEEKLIALEEDWKFRQMCEADEQYTDEDIRRMYEEYMREL